MFSCSLTDQSIEIQIRDRETSYLELSYYRRPCPRDPVTVSPMRRAIVKVRCYTIIAMTRPTITTRSLMSLVSPQTTTASDLSVKERRTVKVIRSVRGSVVTRLIPHLIRLRLSWSGGSIPRWRPGVHPTQIIILAL